MALAAAIHDRLASGRYGAVAAALLLCCTAKAEFPLRANSALYREPGEVSAAAWVERERQRPGNGYGVQLQFVAAEGLEIQLSFARRYQREEDGAPLRVLHGGEIELVWVPWRRAHAWSWGIVASGAREGEERGAEIALIGSRPLAEDHPRALHVNMGRAREREGEERMQRTVLTVAYEHGVNRDTTLLAEVQAQQRDGPLRHFGIRYRVARDLHLGAMAGKDGAGSIARIGMSIEYD
jgi:hypothetical protein